MAFGFNSDYAQHIQDINKTPWELAESAARTRAQNLDTQIKERQEAEANTKDAIKARELQRKLVLKDEEAKLTRRITRPLEPFARNQDINGFKRAYTQAYQDDLADGIIDDIWDDPSKMTDEDWLTEMKSVSDLADLFISPDTELAKRATSEVDRNAAAKIAEQVAKTGQGYDLAKIDRQGMWSLRAANARADDSNKPIPPKDKAKAIETTIKTAGLGNQQKYIATTSPYIADVVNTIRKSDPIKYGETELDPTDKDDAQVLASIGRALHSRTVAEVQRQGQDFVNGKTDVQPDIDAIQERILSEMIESGEIGENDDFFTDTTFSPGASKKKEEIKKPAGISQAVWDKMSPEDKELFK